MRAWRFLGQTRRNSTGTNTNLDQRSGGSNMTDVTALVVLVLLSSGAAGVPKPESGYCIGSECFTLFRESSTFQSAQSQCGDAGGHLMTVRSSVAHDVLQTLLASFVGRFWIGLHLPSGCPDDSAALGGFQWVTKDSGSDFSNWLSFDSSCAPSRRCVSVSTEHDLKWVQTPCQERAAGFLCETSFSDPCRTLDVAPGESVSYKIPLGFTDEDLLFAPPGSVATRMPSEKTSICISQHWLDAPWSSDVNEGGCEHQCAVDADNVPSCYCPPGQTVNPANKVSCERQEAVHPCTNLGCEQLCYETDGVHACECDHGFQLAEDGKSCVDFDDCADERQCPGENVRCVNTHGSFQCLCKVGYKKSGGRCVDVDECESAPCEHMCTNTRGSYTCSCFEGHAQDPESAHKCVLFCGREACPAVCDPNDQNQCFCPEGYILDQADTGSVCVDMDECAYSHCDQECANTFGSFSCSCSPGFTLSGAYACVKTDDEDGDGGSEGSGRTPTPDNLATPSVRLPGPTRGPSVVSAGGLVGIIVCAVFSVALLLFGAHLVFRCRRKQERACA